MLEQLRTFLSPQVYPILMALAITVLALVLVSNMRRIVTLLLQRSTPHWVDRVTLLLQAGVLVGELAFMLYLIASNWLVALLASLVVALVAASLLPGNPISARVALLRFHGLRYDQVGVWVTSALRYLRARLQTLIQTLGRLGKRGVAHTARIGSTIQAVPMIASRLPAGNVAVMPTATDVNEKPARVEQARPLMPPGQTFKAPLGKTAPLVKRPALGKRSSKSLLYKKLY
ncbi:MAG: hypothetical protein NT075_03985 [Chloroflexi bacterium]|nr:hypothetical protein [Chloroflexota bacterium]